MRREKISPALRRKTVTEIETGRLSQREAAKRLNVGRVTIQGWLSKYRSEGSSGLERNSENRIYSVQAKQQAVKAYLTGKYSQQRICEIFKIRDRRQLRNWLKAYHSGSEHNDNPIVFDTFKAAVKANPDAHPLFHSDRGFQYTNRTFHHMLKEAGMTQRMPRVAHCIDNGPMEGFWGILKREKYYGKRFTSKKELVRMIRDYIYYNTQRVQRNLGVVTPLEKFQMAFAA